MLSHSLGECTQPLAGAYKCLCSDGISGVDCELVNSVYITPGGSMRLPNPSSEDALSLQFNYLTLDTTGILLWALAVSCHYIYLLPTLLYLLYTNLTSALSCSYYRSDYL